MIEFKKLTPDELPALSEYFSKQTTRISVYSAAYQFMWNRELYAPLYAVVENCLVLLSRFQNKSYFYYPLSKGGVEAEEVAAIEKIENYCRENYTPLKFINVPEERAAWFCSRYSLGLHIETIRTWNDYLYKAEDFKSYPGKKFGGQRNHVNKFYRNYPDAEFKRFQSGDKQKLYDFLAEFKQTQFKKTDAIAVRELALVKELIEKIEPFRLCCGYMEVEGKVVSFAVGAVCGDTLMEHVEKGLKEYEGVYPATAQAFVKTFASEEIVYLNREDDSGDLGLRKSKMQYNPCRLVRKYTIEADKPLQRVKTPPTLRGERVTLKKIAEKDGDEYCRLASDVDRNEWWGFDYRSALKGKAPTAEFFLGIIRNDFKERNEMSLGIYLNGQLIGEGVLYNLGYRGEAEVGVRLLPEFEGHGYAGEAIRLLTEFAFIELGAEVVEAKCFKQNERSRKLMEGAGMRFRGEDETYYRFYRTPSM